MVLQAHEIRQAALKAGYSAKSLSAASGVSYGKCYAILHGVNNGGKSRTFKESTQEYVLVGLTRLLDPAALVPGSKVTVPKGAHK
jgi:hypothetical protein